MKDKNAIAQMCNAIANIDIKATPTATLEQHLKDIDSLKDSMKGLEKKIKAQIYANVPEDIRNEIRLAWERSNIKCTVKTHIPITIYVDRGGHDWVNRWTDHPYFMDDDIESVPISADAWKEVHTYEELVSKRLDRFNSLSRSVEERFGVDPFDILDEDEV